MNENAKKLVAALRSGDYKQTFNRLRDKDGFCCLGVACDISGLGSWEFKINSGYSYTTSAEEEIHELPLEVRNWLDFSYTNSQYDGADYLTSLTAINDGGASFEHIADIIESEPPGLFKESA